MEFLEFEQRNLDLLEALPNKQSKHCFRSAINHLKRAELLFKIDSSMAVFRCITAEEEAASGIFYCLKDKNYRNAGKLAPWKHQHKHGLIPFFQALCQFVEDYFRELDIELYLSHIQQKDSIELRFEAKMKATDGQTIHFHPDPPLNFQLIHENKKFSYKPQLAKLLKKENILNIRNLIKDKANLRNKLLYATPQGFPSEIEVEPKFFPAYRNRVMSLLNTYLMIEPFRELQPFVQDSLDAFLSMIDVIEAEDANLHTHL